MLNNFKLYNVHAEIIEIEKWSIHSENKNYIEDRKKALPKIE